MAKQYELTKKELEEAIKLWEEHKPMKPIREELGGDYYFRCPLLVCDKIVKREWVSCPFCSQKLNWEDYE